MKIKTLIALVGGVMATGLAQAQPEEPYIGLDYANFIFKSTSPSNPTGSNANLGAALVRFGDNLNEYLAIEAHGATGVRNYDWNVSGSAVGLGLYGFGAGFVKPQLQLDGFSVYGLVGYAWYTLGVSGSTAPTTSSSDHGGAIGAGASLPLSVGGRWAVNGSYVRYSSTMSYLSAGVLYHF